MVLVLWTLEQIGGEVYTFSTRLALARENALLYVFEVEAKICNLNRNYYSPQSLYFRSSLKRNRLAAKFS